MKKLLLCVLCVFVVTPVFCEPRNVLLITIDTLRADYLSCNGSTEVQTPHLDKLAAGGANFTRTRSCVPLTLPSHASILTALYPPAHGVRDNGTFRLDSKYMTLAEVFKKHGYDTAAFLGSFVLDHRFGLDQGFDVYNDRMPGDSLVLENLEAERNAEAVSLAFTDWMKSRNSKAPFFVWIHLYDPHTPYLPPEPYLTKFATNRYAGEVAYTDFIIGKIIRDLEIRKITNNSIVAVVADHGEGLGEHQEKTHSLLTYNSTLHVPMMIFAPGLVPSGVTVSSLSRTIDLAPTLLDYLGISETFGSGNSLRNVIDKKTSPAEILSYSESLYPRLNLGWSELHGIESAKYHFILAPKPELYDLQEDPDESKNVIKNHSDIARQLQRQVEELKGGQSGKPAVLDEESKEKLSSLGYLSGSPEPPPTGIDPKDKMAVWNEIQIGLIEFKERDYRAAIKALEEVRKSNKEILLVYEYLGSCYMALKQWPEAQKVYTEALQRGQDSSGVHMNIGISSYEMKDYGRALEELERAVAIDSRNVSAQYYLGNVLRVRGELLKAVEHYKIAIQINPKFIYAANGLGMTYAALKRDDEALRYFKQAVQLDSQNTPAYFNLAVQLELMGRSKEAVVAYKTFLQQSNGKEFEQQRAKAEEALRRLQ